MVIVFKHFTFLFARSYNQNRANVYNSLFYNILPHSTPILIVHISYIPVYDFLKLSKFHTSATVTPSEGVGKWRESMTPSEGVEKHCSDGIASAGTVRRRCTKHGTMTPSEGVEKWRKARLLPKEWKSTAATVSPLQALYAGDAQNMAP